MNTDKFVKEVRATFGEVDMSSFVWTNMTGSEYFKVKTVSGKTVVHLMGAWLVSDSPIEITGQI